MPQAAGGVCRPRGRGRGRATNPRHSNRYTRGTARRPRVVSHVDPTLWTTGQWHPVTIRPFSKLKLSANLTWWSESQQLTGLNLLTPKRGAREIVSGATKGWEDQSPSPQNECTPVLGTLQDPRNRPAGLGDWKTANENGVLSAAHLRPVLLTYSVMFQLLRTHGQW